jgi:hypothetical protein
MPRKLYKKRHRIPSRENLGCSSAPSVADSNHFAGRGSARLRIQDSKPEPIVNIHAEVDLILTH